MSSSGRGVPATPCPECGGQRVAARLRARVEVRIVQAPEAAFFPRSSPLRALVCTAYGYTSLYATRPEKLVRKPLEM
jgi:hypothetical protein